ncbi:MAG: orotidine-5'-phosphate decarboxylase [Planctomycetes bacterium]|nr:orotidine-5'-phosphate decarboxylase [Planctomycetota bacterium]MCP4838080.1 orotidine-5'-phosphate decarboxylase [Planctomycetota bacterium]
MKAVQRAIDPATRLLRSMDRTGCAACVGLDPVLDRIPSQEGFGNAVAAIRSFSLGVIDAVAERVACVKVQSACFERYGADGLEALSDVVDAATARDLPVILDAKRGDIGVSARHYAAAAFDSRGDRGVDWLTVNGYLGSETIEPYLERGGVFILVRTSNAGSGEIQMLRLDDGRTVSEAMADMVASLAAPRIGECGWSDVGAVVGATHPAEIASLRDRMPGVICLVPGIGAQGGRVEDLGGLCGSDGHGAIFTASRSVIYADQVAGQSWEEAIRDAASRLAETTGRIAGLR